jgi:hypothetical protein
VEVVDEGSAFDLLDESILAVAGIYLTTPTSSKVWPVHKALGGGFD